MNKIYKDLKDTVEPYFYNLIVKNIEGRIVYFNKSVINAIKLRKAIKYYFLKNVCGVKDGKTIKIDSIFNFDEETSDNYEFDIRHDSDSHIKIMKETVMEVLENLSLPTIVYPVRNSIDKYLLENADKIEALLKSK
jgi:hypothetical protein